MDWRETFLGFSAQASPEVGGRYHVERPPGHFWTVKHETRAAGRQWCLRHIDGPWATLVEAKAGAEADNLALAQQRQLHTRAGG